MHTILRPAIKYTHTTSNALQPRYTRHSLYFETMWRFTWVTYSLALILLKIRESIVCVLRESIVRVQPPALGFCLNAWMVAVSLQSPSCSFTVLKGSEMEEMSAKQWWQLLKNICMTRCFFVIICMPLMVVMYFVRVITGKPPLQPRAFTPCHSKVKRQTFIHPHTLNATILHVCAC